MRHLLHFEHRRQPVVPMGRFLSRLGRNLLFGILVIFAALAVGMAGYMYLGGMGLIDAFVNAAMILSGMGPLGELKDDGIKIFAGFYALFSGILFIAVTGLVLAPVFHRVLHRFHVEAGEEERKKMSTPRANGKKSGG
jgi:hypothetical protein